jgi:transposase InsO family protein
MKRWVEPQTRDAVVDFVHHWEERTSLQRGLFLRHLGLRRNKFSSWESRHGKENFHNGKIHRDFWLEEWEKEKIAEYYRGHATEGYRAVTYRMMDEDIVAVAPSTVYRVLKSQGFFTRWNVRPDSRKGSGFQQPLKPHDHWHVDISYLNLCGTFYYFMAVLDGCSRYIIHWDIRESMTEHDVELVIQRARELCPDARPRIISDNGPQFVSKDFKEFIRISGMSHVRTSPYYPQANGKFERFNRTIKTECIRPKAPLSLDDARRLVTDFIETYNTKRLHSAIGFVAPYDRLIGRHEEIFQARDAKLDAARARRKAVRERVLMAA